MWHNCEAKLGGTEGHGLPPNSDLHYSSAHQPTEYCPISQPSKFLQRIDVMRVMTL